MVGIAPAAFWTDFTPASLAAAFREYRDDRHDRAVEADERAAVVVKVLAAANGETNFDPSPLFPRLWTDPEDVDDAALQRKVMSWVSLYRSSRTVEA